MKRTMVVVAAAVLMLAAVPGAQMLPPYGSAAEFTTDLGVRRAAAMQALGPESVLILWSAPARVYSTDVNYEYRQESNALYLTGLAQEDSILVLIPGAKTKKEMLFVREGDPRRELWNGHTLTLTEVTSWTGIQNVQPLTSFQPFIDSLLSGNGSPQLPADELQNEFGTFVAAVKQGTAKLAVMGGGPAQGGRGGAAPATPAAGSPRAFAEEMHAKYAGVASANATSILSTLRQVKTPYEQKVLRRSVEISAEAHVEGMKAARPGRWEYEVEAAIEYWYMKNGALSWGYPSIVGSGPNATTLHYEKSTRQMQNGDLLLVDAAANFQGLTGDITRTYPVNGKYSAEQRAIYELVLEAQEAGIAAAKPGSPTAAITQACRAVFARGLLALGLITEAQPGDAQNAQVSRWFTHGPVHGIGMDVHDPLGQQLAAGSAFVIEPGMYIREAVLDQLPKSPENDAFIAKVRPAVQKYKNIGVRIEDSFLMTADGLVLLSVKAPRQIKDIEKIVGTGR
jgi:Xaa-Pro aminopeptidase